MEAYQWNDDERDTSDYIKNTNNEKSIDRKYLPLGNIHRDIIKYLADANDETYFQDDMVYRDYAYESPIYSDYYESEDSASTEEAETEETEVQDELDPDTSGFMYI